MVTNINLCAKVVLGFRNIFNIMKLNSKIVGIFMIWSTEKSPKVEEFELENGNKKIIKYMGKAIFGEGFDPYTKSCADYCLELIYDSKGNLISKKIKPNPHQNLSSPYPNGYI